jgi:hypothetical protein
MIERVCVELLVDDGRARSLRELENSDGKLLRVGKLSA